ncbi:MAG: BatD family protein, partial [Bacteroidota bacterium]|nr:BatD family protein [Bacteroidota bacterium]
VAEQTAGLPAPQRPAQQFVGIIKGLLTVHGGIDHPGHRVVREPQLDVAQVGEVARSCAVHGGNGLVRDDGDLVSFVAIGTPQPRVRTEIAIGEQFQVTYALSGGSLRRYSDFNAPDLNRSFLTLHGPATSQQMQIINGRVSTTISWTYVLQARTTGTFTVPAARITYDGSKLASNTVQVRITKAVPKSGGRQGDAGKKADIDLGDELFIRAVANKTDVFIGEPITVTFKLYSRVAFQLDNPIKLPRMVGFWSEDVETPTQLRPKVEVHEGRQYETFMLRKVLYFPTQTGRLAIEPFEVGTTVRVRRKRKTGDEFFDRFFSDPFMDNYENVKKSLLTQKLDINVRPLPVDGQPEDFNGVVGSYDMDVSLDRRVLKANETATLKVTLRGSGNIRLLDEPMITFPAGVDHYDPTISEDVRPEGGTMTGSKTFEYILVPRYAGKVTIPPVTFSYFDLENRQYVTLSSSPFSMDIAEGESRQQAGRLAQEYIDYLAMDVRPLRKIDDTLPRSDDPGIPLPMMVLLYLSPVVAFAAAMLWKQRYDRARGDAAGLRRRRATRVAEKHLQNSRGYLEEGRTDEYYLEIARALWGYVQDKLGLPTSAATVAAVVEALRRMDVDEDLADGIRSALDSVEFARFSPTRASESEMQALYDSTREAIISLEEVLRRKA